MDYSVIEIAPGINLNYIPSPGRSSDFVSIAFLTQLCRDSAALNASIPFVLLSGTSLYPNPDSLSDKISQFQGMKVTPKVDKMGEIHVIGLNAELPSEDIPKSLELFCSILHSPITHGGLFIPQYVSDAKSKLLQFIADSSDFISKCIEQMCCYEDYAISRYGEEQDINNINYKKLTKHYRNLIQSSPIEIVYIGSYPEKKVVSLLRSCFAIVPRGEIDYDIGTDIRLNSVEPDIRTVQFDDENSSGSICCGIRFGDNDISTGLNIAVVFTDLLSYYLEHTYSDISFRLVPDYVKGLLLVTSDCYHDSPESFISIIHKALDCINDKSIPFEYLSETITNSQEQIMSIVNLPGSLSDFYLRCVLAQADPDLDYLYEKIGYVTDDALADFSSKTVFDIILY